MIIVANSAINLSKGYLSNSRSNVSQLKKDCYKKTNKKYLHWQEYMRKFINKIELVACYEG